jgi:hypothetical protein
MEALQDAIGTGSVDQAEMLGRLIRRVANLEAAIAESSSQRRELHNQLVELRGNVSCLDSTISVNLTACSPRSP